MPRRGSILPLTAALVLAAAGFGAASAQSSWTCPTGFAGQTLSVYNWTTYIAENTIADFEAACGVRVIYDTYPTDGDMLARMRQGNPGYDVVVPADVTVPLMIEEGLAVALDHDLLPNLANVGPTFLDLEFDPGNVYSLPYQWGTIGIGYDVEAVGYEITSWRQMFEYDGPVSWLEDVRPMFGVALSILGHDPNTDDVDLIDEAKDYLIANGGNVVYINQDDGQEILLRGEAHVVVEYSGDLFQIIDECACDRYAYVIPDEGANFWVDNLVIPTGASNPELAHAFLDYLMDPQVAADIANYTAYGSPNRAAIAAGLIDADLLADPGIYPRPETETRLFRVVQDATLEQLYNDAWDEVKIFVGR